MRADQKDYSKHKTYCFSFFFFVHSVPSVVEKKDHDHGNTETHGKRGKMSQKKATNTLFFSSVPSVPSVVVKKNA